MEKYIIIIAIVHSYLFAIMFFSKWKKSSSILGFYMLNFFIQSFLFANFHIFRIEQLNPLFYLLISSLSLLDFPLMFMYVKEISEERFKFRAIHLLHFLPAILMLFVQFGMFIGLESSDRTLLFQPKENIGNHEQLQNFMQVYSISILVLFIQVISYSISMLRKLFRHRRNIVANYSYKEKISLNWLFAFVILYLCYFAFEIFIYLFPVLLVSETTYFSIVSLHIFVVGIWGLRQKDIYLTPKVKPLIISQLQNNPPIEQVIPESVEKKLSNDNKKNIEIIKKHELLSDSQKKELAERIAVLMEQEKVYLRAELSLDEMAEMLFIHKNYVSYVINDVFNVNFYNYINNYRIQEAKRMLADPQYNNLSIEGIAKSCGYKSRNVFYPVFKKFEGITPMEFKKKLQE